MELRSYQQELVDKASNLMADGRNPCIVLSTGGGKSLICAEMVRRARERGQRVLAACHRIEIAKHLITSIGAHTGERIGVITANRTTSIQPIMVAMIPTLVRRKQLIERLQGWSYFLDEAHHHQAKSYQSLYEKLQPAEFCGFTATPLTPTGGGLGKFGFTDLVVGPGYRWLRDNGFLAPYRLYGATGEINTDGVSTRGGDFALDELAERVVEVSGSVLRDWRQFNPEGHQTICIGVNVAHAHELAELYRDAGVKAEAVDGTTPPQVRDAMFKRFKNKEITVLCSCSVIEEGTDLPAATCLQLLRPTKSIRLYKQLIGRVLRPQKGKTAVIIDHGGSWRDLPLPCEDVAWSLHDKPKKPSTPREMDEDRQVVQAAPVAVTENAGFVLEEIDPAMELGRRLLKKQAALRKNLFLVEAKGFPCQILSSWANNPQGVSMSDRRRIERLMNLPQGWIDQQAPQVV
jgi:superfamily II DNA or RNA helicase